MKGKQVSMRLLTNTSRILSYAALEDIGESLIVRSLSQKFLLLSLLLSRHSYLSRLWVLRECIWFWWRRLLNRNWMGSCRLRFCLICLVGGWRKRLGKLRLLIIWIKIICLSSNLLTLQVLNLPTASVITPAVGGVKYDFCTLAREILTNSTQKPRLKYFTSWNCCWMLKLKRSDCILSKSLDCIY